MSNKKAGTLHKSIIGPIGITLFAAALWGISGTAAQALFQVYHFPAFGLVALRSLLAGIVLLVWLRPKWPREKQYKMLLYAIVGILPSQLFYFLTIAYSNVVAALLLEYLFVPIVFIYEVVKGRFGFTFGRMAMVLLTVVGLVLLVGGGGGSLHLSLKPIAIATGVLSAFGVAYYYLFSRELTVKYGSWEVAAWGFVIVGIIMLIPGGYTLATLAPITGIGNILIVLGLIAVVAIIGTLLAYGLLLYALQKISSTEVSVIASTEPVFAAIVSFAIFGALLTGLQYLGGALMVLAVIILRILTPEDERAKRNAKL